MKNIQISIIVPVYNVQDYLEECLKSIYAIENIIKEVIIINDGSDDDSFAIMEKFKLEYSTETVLISQKNQGQSAARNCGLSLAHGEYVLFVDSDDTINASMVEELYKYSKDNKLDLLQGQCKVFGDVAEKILPTPEAVLLHPICSGREFIENYCKNASVNKRDFRPEVWLLLVKRDLFSVNDIEFSVGMYFEDELMTLDLILNATRVKSLPLLFYKYRIRDGSTIRSFSERHPASKGKLVIEYCSLLQRKQFNHTFLNCRVIGWAKEAEAYLSLKDILSLFLLKKYKLKDFVLLCLILTKKIACFGKHKDIDQCLLK